MATSVLLWKRKKRQKFSNAVLKFNSNLSTYEDWQKVSNYHLQKHCECSVGLWSYVLAKAFQRIANRRQQTGAGNQWSLEGLNFSSSISCTSLYVSLGGTSSGLNTQKVQCFKTDQRMIHTKFKPMPSKQSGRTCCSAPECDQEISSRSPCVVKKGKISLVES